MLKPGWCQHCGIETADRLGEDGSITWTCVACGAFIGSDKKGAPLGTAANEELRRARAMLRHDMVEPLSRRAIDLPCYAEARALPSESPEGQKKRAIVRRTAEKRVREYAAERLGLDAFAVDMLDIEQCREAWRALRGISYEDVRAWAHARPKAAARPSGRRSPAAT